MNSHERRAAGQIPAPPAQEPAATPAALHAAGLRELGAGRPLDAQLACEQALALDPQHADSLHLMGVLCFRTQQYDHSVAWLVRAIRQEPRPEFLASLGSTLRQQGRRDEALQTFDKAIQLAPGDAELWRQLGEVLAELKRRDEAVLAFRHALTLDPKTISSADQCANLLRELRRFEEALACFIICDELRPNHAQTLYLRGHTLSDLRRYDEALTDLARARTLDPNHPGVCNSLGFVLQALGRHDEALAAFDKALALKPDYVEAVNSKASSLAHFVRFEDALALAERALALQPDYMPARINKAMWLSELRRFDEAFAAYDDALRLDPGNADATWNRSFLHLLTGNFEAGWAGREARWTAQARQETSYPDFAEPRWRGEAPIAGKTLLIYAEEGLGDAIQFARYIPMVAALGAKIILVVAAPILPLMAALPGVTQCLTKPLATRPSFDFHCGMSSLPLIFGTRLDTIPPATYLPLPPQARVNVWRDRLGRRDRLRVGLVWSGLAKHKNDRNRSIPLKALAPLLALEASFISLQKDPRPDDRAVLAQSNMLDLTPHLTDFTETAALLACLDLVITVDTSVAHLSGTLGRPTWVLLPYIPDFRWLLEREDSPWYPSIRLFRQSENRDYADVIERVREELTALISATKTG